MWQVSSQPSCDGEWTDYGAGRPEHEKSGRYGAKVRAKEVSTISPQIRGAPIGLLWIKSAHVTPPPLLISKPPKCLTQIDIHVVYAKRVYARVLAPSLERRSENKGEPQLAIGGAT